MPSLVKSQAKSVLNSRSRKCDVTYIPDASHILAFMAQKLSYNRLDLIVDTWMPQTVTFQANEHEVPFYPRTEVTREAIVGTRYHDPEKPRRPRAFWA